MKESSAGFFGFEIGGRGSTPGFTIDFSVTWALALLAPDSNFAFL
jgi:hypothetical protein